MGCGKAPDNGAELRAQDEERQARVAQGNAAIYKNFSGFDDNFYANRVKDYEAFAVPQLTSQYDTTKKNLIYSLARSGLLGSSSQAEKSGDLDKEMAQQYRNVVDTGQNQANDLRKTIEGQRSNLVAQNEAAGDPGSAANLALRTAQAYETPTNFAPIGNFFQNWTQNYLQNQEARQYAPASGGGEMFPWGTTTQRTVR